jgi:hypothetical protein
MTDRQTCFASDADQRPFHSQNRLIASPPPSRTLKSSPPSLAATQILHLTLTHSHSLKSSIHIASLFLTQISSFALHHSHSLKSSPSHCTTLPHSRASTVRWRTHYSHDSFCPHPYPHTHCITTYPHHTLADNSKITYILRE